MTIEKTALARLSEDGGVDGRTWTEQELRRVAELKDSPYWPALQQLLAREAKNHRGPVLDERTDFAQTQFHRGYLKAIESMVLTITVEAPELIRREAGKDDDA